VSISCDVDCTYTQYPISVSHQSYFEVVSLVVYVHGYVVFIFVRLRLPDKRRPLFGFQGNLNSNHI